MEKAKSRERSSSVGLLEDMWSRKREEEDVLNRSEEGKGERIFQKSKKTRRSPIGSGEKEGEGKLEKLLMEMRKESRQRWTRLEESLGEIGKELNKMKGKGGVEKGTVHDGGEDTNGGEEIRGKSGRGGRW